MGVKWLDYAPGFPMVGSNAGSIPATSTNGAKHEGRFGCVVIHESLSPESVGRCARGHAPSIITAQAGADKHWLVRYMARRVA